MSTRTRIELGRRADLGADCANCFGLCCVALAFTKSADFPFDKPAGDPCTNLDEHDGCRIHPQLRDRGFKGCTVFDCFGAGQKVSRQTFAGRSWRDDASTREAMFSTFPLVRRLHELLWYLDEAIALVERESERLEATTPDPAPWLTAFEHVRLLADGTPDELAALDVDAEYDAARPLLVQASEVARAAVPAPPRRSKGKGPALEPGSDLMGAGLAGADLRGRTLRGSIAIAADLRGADMDRCDLLGVDLRDADLSGADLSGAIYLTQMQVNSARGDAVTRLPEGFARPSHWAVGR
ncbi:pentapeptide repeat-containing protein [Frigoribacterium sp. VKM Ac-2836]|uniref:pentapeptide repeat-containing protein n=1 Tax=Frigoribacterium sp. VKM Ac-2836 TaxID=2739014 RepID=UPI0015640BA1|nr:pentapeptide repeat-containing protein [Frigoribacterium sp. VKM Ac-2836]NRD27735.1 pentapeptide repeat-containing protein [Frigoribacterium sp. VKM Ac-2836]